MNAISSIPHYSTPYTPAAQKPQRKSLADFLVTEKECTPDSIGIATIPDDRWEEFKAVYAEYAKEGKEAEMRAAREPGADRADLTPEQIKYLKEKYNPRRMTQEEYSDFVHDLVKFGVLTNDHVPYLQANGFELVGVSIFHSVGISGTYCNGLKFMGEPMSLADSNGDALRWTKFESLFQKYDEDTGTYYLGRQALAFSKVHSALEQIDDGSPALSPASSSAPSSYHQPERLYWDLKMRRA